METLPTRTSCTAIILSILIAVSIVTAGVGTGAQTGALSTTSSIESPNGALNASDVSIEQSPGTTSGGGNNTTSLVGIKADANLTINNGSNYHFKFTNEDSGGSVTGSINGSFEVPARNHMAFMTYENDGSINQNPSIWVVGQGQVSFNIEDGKIPAAYGPTNFSVELLNASTGESLASTQSLPSVVAYTGRLNRNSTEGNIRFSVPRDVMPRNTTTKLTFSQEGDDKAPRHEVELEYEQSTDEFATVIDAEKFEDGKYSWKATFEMFGFQAHQIGDFYYPPITIQSGPPPVTGSDPPTDPDGDGKYEDVNGDGAVDFEDAVALAFNLNDDNVQPQWFDFDGDGDVDFDDAVTLAFA